ncbi:MAG TPA: XRE family transcriptional regulator, partial [Micromonospora sp.]
MNHGLIAAMAEAGETADSLAGRVGVDPKTA